MNIIKYFNLPKKSQINQRITIKEFIEQLEPKAKEKRIISSSIKTIYLKAVLNADTIRINEYISEDYLYQAIYIIEVELKTNKNLTTVIERLHYVFPNPVILVFNYNNKHIISLAPKRINKIEKDKSVVIDIFNTNEFQLDNEHKQFLKNLDIENIEENNLKSFYEELTNIVYSEKLIEILNEYPKQLIDKEKLKFILKEIEAETSKLNKFKDEYKQKSMMSSKMDAHMKIVKQEEKLRKYIKNLKEEFNNE